MTASMSAPAAYEGSTKPYAPESQASASGSRIAIGATASSENTTPCTMTTAILR